MQETGAPHRPATGAPSDWVVRWTPLLLPGSSVLDLACGAGRHVRWLVQAGHRVTGVDRDGEALARAEACVAAAGPGRLRTVLADLEGAPWPLPGEHFDAVVVTNYLWRPLMPALLAAVAPGGLLVYETFASAQAALGRPRRPEFLLQPGELLAWLRPPSAGWQVSSSIARADTDIGSHAADAAPPDIEAPAAEAGWHVVAFEEGRLPGHGEVPAREVQRIVARRGTSPPGRPDLLLPAG